MASGSILTGWPTGPVSAEVVAPWPQFSQTMLRVSQASGIQLGRPSGRMLVEQSLWGAVARVAVQPLSVVEHLDAVRVPHPGTRPDGERFLVVHPIL